MQLQQPLDRKAIVPIAIMALLLLAYTTVRAVTVSFSWDESYTFMHHVRKGVFYQDAFDKMGGNHHLLNVWLMWFSMKVFGAGELALRLPSLFAHACYLYATSRIALKAQRPWLAVAVFVLLNVHPYLLDFFSLARGYGLAMGWMMLSAWSIWNWLEMDKARRWLMRASAFAVLAALSHVIMINYLLAFDVVVAGWLLFEARRKSVRRPLVDLAWVAGISLLGLCIMLPNAIGLFQGGSLNFGCDTAYWCMLFTLGVKVLYHMPYADHALPIMTAFIGGVLLLFFLSAVVAWHKNRVPEIRPALFIFLLLAVCLLSFFTQHKLFGVPWPQTRTALFLLPLLALLLCASLIALPRPNFGVALVAMLFGLPLLFHQYKSINTKYAVEWKPSGELRTMLEAIERDRVTLPVERSVTTLGISFESWGSLSYYAFVRGMTWLTADVREAPNDFVRSDYYIVEYDGYDKVDTANWTVVYRSEATNTTLYRDERLRAQTLSTLFHVKHDMEDREAVGGTTEDHVSGSRCVKFDAAVRSTRPIEWVLPEVPVEGPLLITGTAMVKQPNDSNWVALRIRVFRNDRVLEERMSGSVPQTAHFGEWNRTGVALRTLSDHLPGDKVVFDVVPCFPSPDILIDDMELTVLRQ